ncbi:MAG: DNA phosphorothioation-associated putative methyltransferase [Prochlorotrichaceae cyanobacterium]
MTDWERVTTVCKQSPLGKRLPDALYVHCSALTQLDPWLQTVATQARSLLPHDLEVTLLKFHFSQPQISFLCYSCFDADPHPALDYSVQVNVETHQVQRRDYGQTLNPPVLHRKETFVLATYPHYATFATLTHQEEKLGLLKQSHQIGTRLNWQQRLKSYGLEIHDHALACTIAQRFPAAPCKPTIDRHRAAIHRNALSKPVRLAREAGLLPPGTSFFDYGCGRGGDITRLAKAGCVAEGWDPYYQGDTPWMQAEVVNLGYIINVIEDPQERREALLNAWQLARRVLVVAAQVLVEDANRGWLAYGDGVITSRNTFQKYYEQEELKAYIDQVLGVDAIPIALGIYLVFRESAEAEVFRASRFRSRATTPRVNTKVSRFEEYRSLLQPLMDFYTERGRLPNSEEIAAQADLQAITEQFNSIKQAFNLILKATNAAEWDGLREQRRQDWLVYLALTQFGKRPRLSELDPVTQGDLKGLFGSYKEACVAADLMLMSVGNLSLLREACQRSAVGLLYKKSLWLHCDRLEELDPLLRLYEGCGARTFGRPEGATIVRLHWKQAAITYYTPEHFDQDPHPLVRNAMKIDLKSARVYYQEYDRTENPPVLVCKDRLVSPQYPHYNKFAKLTQQEYQWGILEDTVLRERGWNLRQWQAQVRDRGACLKGHRLVWRKDLDPYQRKLLESQQRSSSPSPPKQSSNPESKLNGL